MTIKKLLQSLVGHKVKFVVIGGMSFPAYGYVRSTYDIDIEESRRANKRLVRFRVLKGNQEANKKGKK